MAEYIEREAVLKYPIRTNHCDKENANEHFIYGIESVMEYAESLPAADVVEVVPELRKAVELLCKKYEKAKQNPVVRDPLAYALYQTWKAVDGRRNGG